MNDAPLPQTDRRFRAIECYNQAILAVKADPMAAYRLLSSSVMIDPTFAQGWFMLGCSNADLTLWHGAVAAYRRAVTLPDGDAAGDMKPVTRRNLRRTSRIGFTTWARSTTPGRRTRKPWR